MHDGNYGGSCRAQRERHSQFLWQCLDVLYLCVSVWKIESVFFFFFSAREVFTFTGKLFKRENLNSFKVVTISRI